MGTPAQMKALMMKCYDCGRFVCGSCAASERIPGMVQFKCSFCSGDMGPCDA
jgi:hypothetical protein